MGFLPLFSLTISLFRLKVCLHTIYFFLVALALADKWQLLIRTLHSRWQLKLTLMFKLPLSEKSLLTKIHWITHKWIHKYSHKQFIRRSCSILQQLCYKEKNSSLNSFCLGYVIRNVNEFTSIYVCIDSYIYACIYINIVSMCPQSSETVNQWVWWALK